MKRFILPVSALAWLTLTGCSSSGEPSAAPEPKPSSLENPDSVRDWANSVSAFALYGYLYQPIAIADGQQTFDDPACPVTEDDGTTLSMTGGCTDRSGTAWLGAASVERSASGDRTLTLADFGTQAAGKDRDTKNGTGSLRRVDDDNHDFSLELVHEAGRRTTIDYEGHVTGGYDTRTVWSGSGTITREGPEPAGTVDVSTTAEVVDDSVCSGYPASGNTTIHDQAGETVVVTYDGEISCDGNASYSYNGVAKGEITGISCAVQPRRGGSRSSALVALALGCAFGLRRRRAR